MNHVVGDMPIWVQGIAYGIVGLLTIQAAVALIFGRGAADEAIGQVVGAVLVWLGAVLLKAPRLIGGSIMSGMSSAFGSSLLGSIKGLNTQNFARTNVATEGGLDSEGENAVRSSRKNSDRSDHQFDEEVPSRSPEPIQDGDLHDEIVDGKDTAGEQKSESKGNASERTDGSNSTDTQPNKPTPNEHKETE